MVVAQAVIGSVAAPSIAVWDFASLSIEAGSASQAASAASQQPTAVMESSILNDQFRCLSRLEAERFADVTHTHALSPRVTMALTCIRPLRT